MSLAGRGTPAAEAPAAAEATRRRRRPVSARARQDARTGLALITPTFVIVLAMVVLPILWTVSLAFQNVRLLNLRTTSIIGDYSIENFTDVLTSDGFLGALLTTLVYSIGGTFGAIALGLVAALAMRKPFRGRGLARAALLLPYVAPVVAAVFVWSTMLNPQFGLVNHWGQQLLGWDEGIAFLSSREDRLLGIPVPTALITVILFEAWRSFPFAFLFITARLEAVPGTLEEAGQIDGASPLQRFRFLILPQLAPTIAVLSVLRFIWTYNNFDDIYLLTGGGAGTEVVSVRVFNYLTARGDIGAAAAQSLVLAIILAVIVVVYLRVFGRKEMAS